MKSISLDITKATQFLSKGAVEAYESKVAASHEALENGTCPGNDFLGWLHLPSSITPEFIAELQSVANTLREKCEVVVVAGIGGSYLGARAVIEALGNSFAWLVQDKKNPTVVFAGNNIGEDYLAELTDYLKDKKFGVINISKSGTTTETALAFRLLKKQCEEQRGKEEAKKVIVAMEHTSKNGPKIVKKCSLPLTAAKEVDLIITERCVISVEPEGLVLKEINPLFSLDDVLSTISADLIMPDEFNQAAA